MTKPQREMISIPSPAVFRITKEPTTKAPLDNLQTSKNYSSKNIIQFHQKDKLKQATQKEIAENERIMLVKKKEEEKGGKKNYSSNKHQKRMQIFTKT